MFVKKIILIVAVLISIPFVCFSSDFTDNGDGTITDNKTGLMWMKKTSDQEMTWQDALKFCENLDLAGYKDWRIPNIKELRSIVDYTSFSPAIDKKFFPDTKPRRYWSSTTDLDGASHVLQINFDFGSQKDASKIVTKCNFRAVRGGR